MQIHFQKHLFIMFVVGQWMDMLQGKPKSELLGQKIINKSFMSSKGELRGEKRWGGICAGECGVTGVSPALTSVKQRKG